MVYSNWQSVCHSSLASTVTTVLHSWSLCSQHQIFVFTRAFAARHVHHAQSRTHGECLTTASGATHLHALSALNVCTKGRHSVQRPGNFIKNSRKTIKETPSCLFKIHSCISSKIYSCEKYYGNNWLYFCLQGMFFIFNQYYSANGVLEGRWLFLKEYSCSAVCLTVSTCLYAEMWLKAGDL